MAIVARGQFTITDLNDGADGRGINTITNYYLATSSSSGVTTSTSGWTTTPQTTTTTNKYLWNYVVITYTTGSPTTSTPLIIGTHGATGSDGKGVSSTVVTYQASTSGTTTPTGTWSTTIPTVSAGQFLWTRTVITYTDSTTSTSYSIGKMGSNGSTGATGTGITSVTEEYYLSTSKTTQTGGTWVTSPPAWVKGTYLWTRNKIVYKNPTSTAYTDPVCDSSWEAVNAVEARVTTAEQKILPASIVATVKDSIETDGTPTFAQTSTVIQTAKNVTYDFMSSVGNNMIYNSMFKDASTDGWRFYTGYKWADLSYYSEGDMFIANPSVTSHALMYAYSVPAKPNTEYTISIAMSKEGGVTGASIRLLWQSDTQKDNINASLITTTITPILDGVRHSYTFTSPTDTSIKYVLFAIRMEKSTTSTGGFLTRVNRPCMMEGPIAPYQQSPNEVINGATVIDGSGVTIKNGAIKILNNSGQTVMSGDSSGNLTLQSLLTVGGSTDGRIELKNASNDIVIGMNKRGIACTGIDFYKTISLSGGIYNGDKLSYLTITGNDGLLNYERDETGGYEHKTVKIREGKIIVGGYSGSQYDPYDGVVIERATVTASTLVAREVHATSNGQGTNFKIGDDCWLGDINEYATVRLACTDGSGKGYLRFGGGGKIGYNGSTAIEILGNSWTVGWMVADNGFAIINPTDRIHNAPWYGLGNTNYGTGGDGNAVQLAGYWGVTLRTGATILELRFDDYILAKGHFCPLNTRSYWLGTNGPDRQWKGLCAEGGTVGASDIRRKENVTRLDGTIVAYDELSDQLREVSLLGLNNTRATEEEYYNFIKDRFKPAYYNYKLSETVSEENGEYVIGPGDEYNMLKNVGFIAQDYDLETDLVAKEFIIKDSSGMLNYNHMSYVTVGMIALQEAIRKIEELTNRINQLENNIREV